MLNEGNLIEKFINLEHGKVKSRKKRATVEFIKEQKQKLTFESSSSLHIRASNRFK
jgi:di/tripeptidase